MMIHNDEFAPDGTVVRSEVVDLDAGTITVYEHAVLVSSRAITLDERAAYGAPPLDPVGSLAALLAATGVVAVADAAAAVGLTADDLTHEVTAWQVAADQANP